MSREIIFKSDRYFQFFEYFMGHSQLVLRSFPAASEPWCLDLHFVAVRNTHLNTSLWGVEIRAFEELDFENYSPSMKKFLDYKNVGIYEILSEGEKHRIVASQLRVRKNEAGLGLRTEEYYKTEVIAFHYF
jgi:hypothetical protein